MAGPGPDRRGYTGSPMELSYDEVENDVLIITADGGLNSRNADHFIRSVEKLVDAGLRKIIIDCSKLNHISSYGLGVLVRLHGKMKSHEGDVKIAALRGITPQIMHMTRLDKLFQVYPDVNRARLSFRPTSAESE